MESMIETIRKDHAAFARNVEYLKETALDDMLDARLEVADNLYRPEKRSELLEAVEIANDINIDDDLALESAEIDKILNSDHDMSFTEMTGIIE